MEVKKILVTTQRGIPLGYQGENEVTKIVFPQTEELLAQNWTLLHQRAYDKEPYPVPLTVTAGGLVWTVTSGDTAVSGIGRAQLICSGANGEILKTVTYNTNVAKSLHLCGEVPDPVKPWYEDIMQKLNQAGGGMPDVDELDALAALMDTGIIDPMADETGAVYTDEAGNIYSF